ncbi:DUF3006 domain-containing protein [Clostridium sp. OS1-26]|uniref:DUF3006 domain-containing protein n=1 Tax=Clostridium sp. OS1-26 TaxID=3070681 RepID=UPI0027E015F6|nr:DUF3006 domain-containing protein [Clostridium sp. OS1-26]WML36412.1 DUF3006 domain-containing protein [Clostridium sp. OS1-26]
MFGVLDRFEGSFAIVELYDSKVINIEVNKIPKEAREGDVLSIGEQITIDYEETKKRKNAIEKLSEDMWK